MGGIFMHFLEKSCWDEEEIDYYIPPGSFNYFSFEVHPLFQNNTWVQCPPASYAIFPDIRENEQALAFTGGIFNLFFSKTRLELPEDAGTGTSWIFATNAMQETAGNVAGSLGRTMRLIRLPNIRSFNSSVSCRWKRRPFFTPSPSGCTARQKQTCHSRPE